MGTISITSSTLTTTGKVKSVMNVERNVFHVTSHFDKKTSLAELLFSVASEDLFGNPFLHSDFAKNTRYTKVED